MRWTTPSLQNCWWDLLRAYTSVLLHVVHDQYLVDFSMGRACPVTRRSRLSTQDFPLMGGVKQRMPLGCLAEKSPPCDPHLWVPRPRQPCSLSPQAWGEGCGFLRLLRPQLSIHSSPLCHPRLLPPAQVACDCSEERQLESDTTPLNYSCFF